jgi:hypothetical protein
MALIVQTSGACVPNADSWVSLADANAHFANYGGFWTGEDAAKEAALRRAALWLSTGIKWTGKRSCTSNMLAWPRTGVTDCDGTKIESDEVPTSIVFAQLYAASAELQTPGILTPSITPGQMVKREKVDVIEVEYMTPKDQGVADGGNYDAITALRPTLTAVSDLIRCFIEPSNATPWFFVV